MKALGILLAALGAIAVLAGFGMDGTVGNGGASRVYNTGLLNIKLMLAVAGGAVFVAGAVLVGAAEVATKLAAMGAPSLAENADAPPAGSEAVTEKGEAWRTTHTIVRSTRTGGKRVYFLSDDTVAVEGLNRTFPDVPAALEAANR